MRKIIVFVFIAIAAFAAFVVLSYFDETFLGALLAVIMMMWPTVFWLVSKVIENRSSERKKDDENSINQDIIEEPEGELMTNTRSEKFEEFRKKDENVLKARAELAKLRKSLELINEEKNEGILNDETYNELKKQNEESIEKLEEEIAKSVGDGIEKKVYCKKGKHYISIDDCLPSKIDGYVICQEHNEEIRVE